MVRSCVRRSGFVAIAALAACNSAARVSLVPLGGDCARPPDASAVKVTAYTGSGEHTESVLISETTAVGDFPADTEQIGVEVIGPGGVGAQGKSAPLVFDALADGATIPVFMGPPDGFCAAGAMTEPRAQPLVARAGDGVLVVGGAGLAVGGVGPGAPLSTAEYYDPATATFSPVAVPAALVNPQGFAGAALAELPDGRVALVGGPLSAFAVFDPAARAFGAPVTIQPRAFHAAIATAARDVLVAGGCSALSAGCAGGVPRRQMLSYDLDDPGLADPVVQLPADMALRLGAQLFDLGVQLDGAHRYLLAGGDGDPGLSDRFAVDDIQATTLPGGHVQVAGLDGGAVLTAYGSDSAATPDGTAAVYAPDALAAQSVAKAPDAQGVRLIGLEDGRVVGFGGDARGGAVTYDPTHDAWTYAVPANTPGALAAPSLVRLADGAVLVVGGALASSGAAMASAQAWLYRPSLVGPASGSVTVVPSSDVVRGVITAPDPSTVTRTTTEPPVWHLAVAAGAAMARALVGGPRMAIGSIDAGVHVTGGGVALVAQQVSPGQAIVAELVPGRPAQLVQLADGAVHTLCTGSTTLGMFDPAVLAMLHMAISDHDVEISVAGSGVLSCNVALTDRGAWGVASLGAGGDITVDAVIVAR